MSERERISHDPASPKALHMALRKLGTRKVTGVGKVMLAQITSKHVRVCACVCTVCVRVYYLCV